MTDETNSGEEPKIVVDDDWKSQVEKEKEELKQNQESDPGPESADAMEMPPASFLVLISTLATQTMAALGMFPDPTTGKPAVNRPIAKHMIDTLAMLQEKTKGNLTEEEEGHLRDGLHQLRMAYVSTQNSPAGPDSGAEKSSSIELP